MQSPRVRLAANEWNSNLRHENHTPQQRLNSGVLEHGFKNGTLFAPFRQKVPN